MSSVELFVTRELKSLVWRFSARRHSMKTMWYMHDHVMHACWTLPTRPTILICFNACKRLCCTDELLVPLSACFSAMCSWKDMSCYWQCFALTKAEYIYKNMIWRNVTSIWRQLTNLWGKEFAIPFGIAALNGETFFSWGFFLNQCCAFVCKPCKRRGPMQLRSWGQKSEGQLCSV